MTFVYILYTRLKNLFICFAYFGNQVACGSECRTVECRTVNRTALLLFFFCIGEKFFIYERFPRGLYLLGRGFLLIIGCGVLRRNGSDAALGAPLGGLWVRSSLVEEIQSLAALFLTEQV